MQQCTLFAEKTIFKFHYFMNIDFHIQDGVLLSKIINSEWCCATCFQLQTVLFFIQPALKYSHIKLLFMMCLKSNRNWYANGFIYPTRNTFSYLTYIKLHSLRFSFTQWRLLVCFGLLLFFISCLYWCQYGSENLHWPAALVPQKGNKILGLFLLCE